MALGATTKHILRHYIFESLVTAIIGGIIGLLIMIPVIYLINSIPMNWKIFEHISRNYFS
ncbi:MAG: FtsX-like permease family protein [Coxiellaceae bacterium]|nr:FtsX-like permease family protein [Coxiellaceae bacterium]